MLGGEPAYQVRPFTRYYEEKKAGDKEVSLAELQSEGNRVTSPDKPPSEPYKAASPVELQPEADSIASHILLTPELMV